jgi:hypothetical protein
VLGAGQFHLWCKRPWAEDYAAQPSWIVFEHATCGGINRDELQLLVHVCFAVLLAGPVAHLVRGLCGRVLNNMMEDLRAEVARRQQLEAAGQTVLNTGREGLDCAWTPSSPSGVGSRTGSSGLRGCRIVFQGCRIGFQGFKRSRTDSTVHR